MSAMSERYKEIIAAAIAEGGDPVQYVLDYCHDKGDYPSRRLVQMIVDRYIKSASD